MSEPTSTPTTGNPAPASPSPGTSAPHSGAGSGAPPGAGAPEKTSQPLNDPFADLDELFRDDPADKGAAKGTPETPGAKPEAGDKPKPADAPKLSAPPEEEIPAGPKQLREAYALKVKRVKELEAELSSKKPGEDPEKAQITQRLADAEKRYQELQDEIRFVAYERSQEYRDKYVAPLEAAFKRAYTDIEQLPATDSEGNPIKASPDQFNALLRMSLPQAIKAAKDWFGDASEYVMLRRERIIDLNEARQAAVEQFRKEGGERAKREQDIRQANLQRRNGEFHKLVEDGLTKRPALFKAADDDAKGKELLTKGFEWADRAFTPQATVADHAALRNKAAGYNFAVYRWRAAEAKVKSLEKRLADYEKSEPGAGDATRRAPPGRRGRQLGAGD